MLIKLLVIKIVPNNFLGLSRSLTTVLFPFDADESSSNFVCDIEKKATSVPETNAEHINKTSNKTQLALVIQSILDSKKNNGSGSGSNF